MSVYYRKLLENLDPLPTLTEDHYGEPCADQQTVAKNYKADKIAKEAAHNMLAMMIANRRRADFRAESRLTEEELTEILGKIKAFMAKRGETKQSREKAASWKRHVGRMTRGAEGKTSHAQQATTTMRSRAAQSQAARNVPRSAQRGRAMDVVRR